MAKYKMSIYLEYDNYLSGNENADKFFELEIVVRKYVPSIIENNNLTITDCEYFVRLGSIAFIDEGLQDTNYPSIVFVTFNADLEDIKILRSKLSDILIDKKLINNPYCITLEKV